MDTFKESRCVTKYHLWKIFREDIEESYFKRENMINNKLKAWLKDNYM